MSHVSAALCACSADSHASEDLAKPGLIVRRRFEPFLAFAGAKNSAEILLGASIAHPELPAKDAVAC